MARKLKKDSQEEVVEGAAKAVAPKTDCIEREDTSDASIEESNRSQHLECGARLRSVRIAQNLSRKVVAERLRLTSKQIDALEQDDFAALPGPAAVRGFIRIYAKLLKIPEDTMLGAYAEIMPEAGPYMLHVKPSIGAGERLRGESKSGSSHYWLFILPLLFGLGAWFFYQGHMPKLEVADIIVGGSTLDLPTAKPDQVEVETKVEEEHQVMDLDFGDTGTPASVSEGASVAAQESAQVAGEKEASAVMGKTRLEFSVKQETWFNVVNQSGEVVYDKILYAGNRDVIDVFQPLKIVVGNAFGATLVVDGKPIDLAPYTRGNVARVRLNQ
ncbi:MAG: RodZ domain-containing protein [Methylophilaceae bacterium]